MEGESLETVYQFDYLGCRFTSDGDDAADIGPTPSHDHRGRALALSRPPVARQPLTAVTEDAPLRSECLLDVDARQRGVDPNTKSGGNAERFQFPPTAPHHREVASRGCHRPLIRPADGCTDAETSLAGPYHSDARRPPSVPCGVGNGQTSWPAISTWQPPDGYAPPHTRTRHVSRRPPRMGTRWPISLLPTGKPLRGETPQIIIIEKWITIFASR